MMHHEDKYLRHDLLDHFWAVHTECPHDQLTVCMKYDSYFLLWSKIRKGAVSIRPTICVWMTGYPFLFKLQDENIQETSFLYMHTIDVIFPCSGFLENIPTELSEKFGQSQQGYLRIL